MNVLGVSQDRPQLIFAIEAYSQVLRYELAPFGVDIELVEPSGIATNAWNSYTPEERKDIVAQSQLSNRFIKILIGRMCLQHKKFSGQILLLDRTILELLGFHPIRKTYI